MNGSQERRRELDSAPELQLVLARWRRATDVRPEARQALDARLARASRPRHTAAVWRTTGLVVAASLAGLLIARHFSSLPPGARIAGGVGIPRHEASTVPVRFAFRESGALQVSLIGDFTGWIPQPLRLQRPGGDWSIVLPLREGRYGYAFVVDGVWVADPGAPRAPDDFGRATSIVVVGTEGE